MKNSHYICCIVSLVACIMAYFSQELKTSQALLFTICHLPNVITNALMLIPYIGKAHRSLYNWIELTFI